MQVAFGDSEAGDPYMPDGICHKRWSSLESGGVEEAAVGEKKGRGLMQKPRSGCLGSS